MERELTYADIVGKLKTDPYFGLTFALDNNFPAIKERMAEKGIAVSTPEEAYERILTIARSGNVPFIKHFFYVPYLNDAINGTGGFADFFVQNSPPPPNPATEDGSTGLGLRTMSGFWAGVMSFIGGGLTSLGTTGSGGVPETEAQRLAREAAEKKEAERKKWMLIYWVVGIILFLLLVWALWYFLIRKK